MKVIEAATMRALITFFHPQGSAKLHRFFPKETLEPMKAVEERFPPSLFTLFSPLSWLEKIHFSWLIEHIKALPKALQSSLLALFSTEQRVEIEKEIKLDTSASLTRFVGFFGLEELKKKVLPADLLPIFALPPSELNALLYLQRPQLIHLLNLLGIHDLAYALRQIIDKTLLGKIHAALTQEQMHFLHYCMKQPLKATMAPLNLTGWDGSKQKLHLLLHQRGLLRLGAALAEVHPSLRWHVVHCLDEKRGKVLEKIALTKAPSPLILQCKTQVLHLVKRYQK